MKNINELNIEGLKAAIKLGEDREKRSIEDVVFRRDKVSLGAVLCFMSRLPESRGIYEYFVNANKFALKQEFYLRSKLVLASVGHAGGASFEVDTDFLFALLSDNMNIIRSMAEIETPEIISQRDNPKNPRFHVYMLQQAILGNDEKLNEMLDDAFKYGGKKIREEHERGENFFSLLINKDKSSLENIIQNKHAKIKSSLPVISDYMAVRATIETKLCWLRGIPVSIDSHRVPMDLMPIEPLENYDDVYDFLKSGWIAPKLSVIDRLKRWLN